MNNTKKEMETADYICFLLNSGAADEEMDLKGFDQQTFEGQDFGSEVAYTKEGESLIYTFVLNREVWVECDWIS